MAVKNNTAWEIAQKAADEMPEYVKDDDLTTQKFYERNKEKMTESEARNVLDKLVDSGMLEKQYRRHPVNGARVAVYITPK